MNIMKENEDSKCFVVNSEDQSRTAVIVELDLNLLDLKPDWKDIMWNMRKGLLDFFWKYFCLILPPSLVYSGPLERSSHLHENSQGLREDPLCDPDTIFDAYAQTIEVAVVFMYSIDPEIFVS